MAHAFTPASIVVGIDGSRAAIDAALWAVDEATGRGLPLRLLGAAEPGADPAAAHAAVHAAAAAVQSSGRTDLPAVQTEVATAGPVLALLEASRHAAMICVGPIGLRHVDHDRLGSTVDALIAAAHCPVALVRGGRRPQTGWVVAQLDQTPDSAAVLQFAVEEARMRRAPLRVLGTWQADEHDPDSAAEPERMVRAQLDRRLEHWRTRYPDLDVAPVAVPGSGLSYLEANAAAIGLVVVGARNTAGVAELLSGAGRAALQNTDTSVLVVDPQRLL